MEAFELGVAGERFQPGAKVTVSGEAVETTFINRELLAARLAQAAEPDAKPARKPTARKRSSRRASTGDPVTDFLTSREGQRLGKEVVRGVFGLLKKRL